MSSQARISGRYLLAFLFLALTLHELHELAHTAMGRMLCGAWGERDFNVWRLADGCATPWPGVMGPLFSYLVMFAGVALMRRTEWRGLGVALALAPNPFARLFTAVMGGGDEGVIARFVTGSGKTPALRLAVITVVMILTVPVFVASWRALREVRRRGAMFPLLLILPMVATGVLYFVFGNRLLRAGIGTSPTIFGDPVLLFATSLAALVGTMLTLRWLVFKPQVEAGGATAMQGT